MGSPLGAQRRGGKKGRKVGRNYRWDGVLHSTTKYRMRHQIDPGISRKDAKAKRRERGY
jgi:hypothetical protein